MDPAKEPAMEPMWTVPTDTFLQVILALAKPASHVTDTKNQSYLAGLLADARLGDMLRGATLTKVNVIAILQYLPAIIKHFNVWNFIEAIDPNDVNLDNAGIVAKHYDNDDWEIFANRLWQDLSKNIFIVAMILEYGVNDAEGKPKHDWKIYEFPHVQRIFDSMELEDEQQALLGSRIGVAPVVLAVPATPIEIEIPQESDSNDEPNVIAITAAVVMVHPSGINQEDFVIHKTETLSFTEALKIVQQKCDEFMIREMSALGHTLVIQRKDTSVTFQETESKPDEPEYELVADQSTDPADIFCALALKAKHTADDYIEGAEILQNIKSETIREFLKDIWCFFNSGQMTTKNWGLFVAEVAKFMPPGSARDQVKFQAGRIARYRL